MSPPRPRSRSRCPLEPVWLLQPARNVEEVDLANCRNLGTATLQCLEYSKKLDLVDFRGCALEFENLLFFANRQAPTPPVQ